MKKVVAAVAILSLCIVGTATAFTIKDGEGNKVKVSPLGVKVSTSTGEKVSVTVAGVKVTDGKGAKVNVSPVGVKATDGEGDKVSIGATGVEVVADGEAITKTGVLLANEHKIVSEARRSAMNFDEVVVSKAIRLVVEERTEGNIIVRAPQSVMPYVSLSVSSGTLYATIASGAPVSSKSNVVAEVYIPNNGRIDEVKVSAAAHVVVQPTLNCAELDISAASSSVVEVKTTAREVSIDASGASTIKAELRGAKLDLDLSGASVAELSGEVIEGEADLSGASTLRAEKLQATTLGVECSGASKANVVASRCVAEASGASSIVAKCSQQIDISVSGASSVVYDGEGYVNVISNTGASTIRKR